MGETGQRMTRADDNVVFATGQRFNAFQLSEAMRSVTAGCGGSRANDPAQPL